MRKGLIRKAHLAHNLKKWSAKHPHGCMAAAVPETHLMEVDDVDYIDEALADVYEVSQRSSLEVCLTLTSCHVGSAFSSLTGPLV